MSAPVGGVVWPLCPVGSAARVWWSSAGDPRRRSSVLVVSRARRLSRRPRVGVQPGGLAGVRRTSRFSVGTGGSEWGCFGAVASSGVEGVGDDRLPGGIGGDLPGHIRRYLPPPLKVAGFASQSCGGGGVDDDVRPRGRSGGLGAAVRARTIRAFAGHRGARQQ
ncbi:MAG: hypothetical protein WBA00_07650 [Rhodococcus sp. (in: high G+C Gram-positive bacteria)]